MSVIPRLRGGLRVSVFSVLAFEGVGNRTFECWITVDVSDAAGFGPPVFSFAVVLLFQAAGGVGFQINADLLRLRFNRGDNDVDVV